MPREILYRRNTIRECKVHDNADEGIHIGLDSDGNVKATSDFRAVYAALLEQWLGFDAARIIPGAAKLTRPMLVK